MVPKASKEQYNVATRYFCTNCGVRLRDSEEVYGGPYANQRWNFCPVCGEKIEWDLVKVEVLA